MKSICYESSKKCNLSCEYCITSDNKLTEDTVKFEEVVHFIARIQPSRIVISGGEPFLDTLLINKLCLIRELCANSYISLSTNGSIDYDLAKVKQYVDCIDISIPTLNNVLYVAMRGKDCLEQVKKTLCKALAQDFHVRISIMLSSVNKHTLFELLDYAESKGVHSVRIGRFLPFRYAAKLRKKYEMSDEEINEIMQEVYSRSYSFDTVPPIESLSSMEAGYVTVNYLGEVFFPTVEGKIPCGTLGGLEQITSKGINEIQEKLFTKMQTKKDRLYENYLSTKRIRDSSSSSFTDRPQLDEFYSDRTRILYFSLFRKLQQKAQVFSLESNSSVRSRLTHSLEVSDIGRRLAVRIAEKLSHPGSSYRLDKEDAAKLIAVVENACLVHDIGNPPFGHFGESAIREWWKKNNVRYIEEYNTRAKGMSLRQLDFNLEETKALLDDFVEFDGNPQGIRAILRLNDGDVDDKKSRTNEIESGLNLTVSTIMCAIKYVRATGPADERTKKLCHAKIIGKGGYFKSEESIIKNVYLKAGLHESRRHPLTYILEAADDIAYRISDISDGIEKGVITASGFMKEFEQCWRKRYKESVPANVLPNDKKNKLQKNRVDDFSIEIGSHWKELIISEVVDRFIGNTSEYMGGYVGPIIEKGSEAGKILDTIEDISHRIIYRSSEAEVIEMAGYSIISGLLNYFGKLLNLTMEEFSYFTNKEKPPKSRNLDLELRIFNRLPKRYVSSYINQLREWEDKNAEYGKQNIEWWLRAHLIVDHIAGMTDDLALQTYQVCNGIDIKLF